jgi:hypothetical protein
MGKNKGLKWYHEKLYENIERCNGYKYKKGESK